MGIEYEKNRALLAIPEIEQQALEKRIILRMDIKSLSMRGNSFAVDGIGYRGEAGPQRIRAKITNSQNKFADFEREEFMYDFIKRLGYPNPSVILSGQTSERSRFLVREYIEGIQLREAPPEILERSLPTLFSFFVDLHSNSLDGFGLLQKSGRTWRGETDDWVGALEKKAKRSFARMEQAKIPIDNKLLGRLLGILNKYSGMLTGVNASLLHGDAGLINFLGDERGLTGIIDTEFALVGDSAYEFSDKVGDGRDYPVDLVNRYLDHMEEKGVDVKPRSFFKRGVIYSPYIVADIIPNLWEAGNHDGAMYFVSILPEEIEKAELV